MRFFVGVLSSNENELDECMRMIEAQSDVEIRLKHIANKPLYDAHVDLYDTWESIKSEFDGFVKIDGDMVLKDEFSLKNIGLELSSAAAQGYTHVQFPLFDHYIEDMIYGLNSYTPATRFEKPNKKFCDRNTVGKKKVIRSQRDTNFDVFPIGTHCQNPSDMQAFMWGIHRGSKHVHAAHEQLKKSYDKNPTTKKKLALLGYAAGDKGSFDDMSYDDNRFMQLFEQAVMNCHK